MSFDLARFRHPPAKLRGAPFWALNHDLTNHDRLREQIDAFAEMGIGGYHLHVRAGLQNDYMGVDFMAAIKAARDYGASKGMLSYLYDEDTWPSGFAGGAVTREHTHRRKFMELAKGRPEIKSDAFRTPVSAYQVELDSQGKLIDAKRIPYDEAADDDWFLTLCVSPDSDRYNGANYVDTLSSAAIRAFIDCTHEVYRESFGGDFPEDVPAIFTDEPNFGPNVSLSRPDEGRAFFGWTGDLVDSFREAWEVDLLDILPWVVWLTPDGPSHWRWRYWDHLAERFAIAYNDQLGKWCGEHGFQLTGHMLNEDTLQNQTGAVGECMRQYREYQIPGIDLLCDAYLPATAKQAVSVARQDGRADVMSELYGVTNWDFPFSGHKVQGDWQAALGITLRVHHLAWISMEGQSKRDYPAVIGPQSPWYREYSLIEDHFARVGAAMTSGKALVRIGFIHPVESAWLNRGVNSLDGQQANQHERTFQDTTNWLLDAGLDFDYISESLLPRQERSTDMAALQVGEMAYEVVVLPNLDTIRQSTLNSLERFMARGGAVIVMGTIPNRCDGVQSDAPTKLLCKAKQIDIDPLALTAALEPWREFAAVNDHDFNINTVNHQIRRIGDDRIVFCSNRAKKTSNSRPWAASHFGGKVRLRGEWRVIELDTVTGEETPCAYCQRDGWTHVPWNCHPQSHRLLRLSPGQGSCELQEVHWTEVADLPEPTEVSRDEPNVLLLDKAPIRVNEEPWLPAADTVMAQLKLATRFGWPDWRQPYSVKDPGPTFNVTRRFMILCDAEFSGVQLMCERLNEATITLDGHPLESNATGWWVDHDLPTMPLPTLTVGVHTLDITLPLNAVNRHLEWCYLLGEFDVDVRGAHARLVQPETVYWGNICQQGMPFYGGNVDYSSNVTIDNTSYYAMQCPNFGGHLLRVWVDGEDRGPIAFAPYRIELGKLSAGEHEIRIRCYGNRMNTFGALHNNRAEWEWWGPPAWRLEGEHRNDIWQLRPTGLLRAPILEKRV